MDDNEARILLKIKTSCEKALGERSRERPTVRMGLEYIRRAEDVDTVIMILTQVVLTQDETAEKMFTALVDAETRAIPKSVIEK